MRRPRDGVGPDRLADPRGRAVEDVPGRLRRDVAWGEAGSTGREDEASRACELTDRVRDLGPVVGHDSADDVVALAPQELLEGSSARVLPRALRDAVGDRQDGDLRQAGSFVLSTRRSSLTTMSRSTAFAMS